METFKFTVTMEYMTQVEIEAESFEEAKSEVQDKIGDGILLRDAELTDYTIDEN